MKRNCPSGLRKPLVFQQGSDWPAKHLDGRGVQTEASAARTAGQVAVYRKTTAKDLVVVDPWSDHPRAALHDPLSWELKSNICSPLFTVCFYLTGLIVLHYILLFFIKKEKTRQPQGGGTNTWLGVWPFTWQMRRWYYSTSHQAVMLQRALEGERVKAGKVLMLKVPAVLCNAGGDKFVKNTKCYHIKTTSSVNKDSYRSQTFAVFVLGFKPSVRTRWGATV